MDGALRDSSKASAAGTVLGLVSGCFLPSLDGPPAHNRVVLLLLASRVHGVLDRWALDDDVLVVAPGRPETKRWWRNLLEPTPVDVLLWGCWHPGRGSLLRPGDAGYEKAIAAYRQRWPRVRLPDDCPLVQIRLSPGRSAITGRP